MAYSPLVRNIHAVTQDETAKKIWKTRLPLGFHFLVTEQTGRPIEPIFEYLCKKHLGGFNALRLRRSRETAKADAYALSDFLRFLDYVGLTIDLVDQRVLERYLETMINVQSTVTERNFSTSTIATRKSSVLGLMDYCQNNGLLKQRIPYGEITTSRGTKTVLAPDLEVPQQLPVDEYVRAVQPEVLKALLDRFGPAACEPNEDGELVQTGEATRDRLMVELALHIGMRRAEVCDLEIETILRLPIEGVGPYVKLPIKVVGKGNVRRSVPVPVWLLDTLSDYISRVRAPLVAQALKGQWLEVDHKKVFVLDVPKKGHLGHPVKPTRFDVYFSYGRDALIKKLKDDGDVQLMRKVIDNRITVHSLRHSFAVTTYIYRHRVERDPDPTKYVQSVLGHKSPETTRSMYLRASHIYESEVSDLMSKLVQTRILAPRQMAP